MSKSFYSGIELIGNTPLLHLQNGFGALHGQVYLKLESFNPAGSVKDRVALSMIETAEEEGRIKPGSVIIEPTSGNTGIGLAFVGIPKGYRVILTMPETMSQERRDLLRAYGAELVLTEGSRGMPGAIEKAEELAGTLSGSFIPGQFDNPANPLAHEKTTGPEIWQATGGNIDCLVAGVGTGGTITGAGRYLRSQNPAVELVAVEPSASPVLSGGKAGGHAIQGIGAGFVPSVLDVSLLSKIVQVGNEDAFATAQEFAKMHGLLLGVSSGAALHAAIELARQREYAGKNIVAVMPDTGERYLSTGLFDSRKG